MVRVARPPRGAFTRDRRVHASSKFPGRAIASPPRPLPARTSAAPTMQLKTPIPDMLDQNEGRLSKSLLMPLLRLFSGSREICGGDADKLFILLSVAARSAEHPAFASFCAEALEQAEAPRPPGLPFNMRSIAESMGIPRETARRKIFQLVQEGWLVRDGASIQMTMKGYARLAPVRQSVKNLAAGYWRIVNTLLTNST
jgi:hypothetical protein